MAERLGFLHRIWRLAPPTLRRAALGTAARVAAPRPDRTPPKTSLGVQTAGEMGRISGLGEAARLLHGGIAALQADAGTIELAIGRRPEPIRPAPRSAMILHANPPSIPLFLARAPRDFLRERRVIGFWNWEIETVPASWRNNADFVHEVWTPTLFTAAALEPIMPGRVRVVPYPLAAILPSARADRDALGLPANTVIITVIANLGASFDRKNPLGAIASFRAAFGDRHDRLLVLKLAGTNLFARDFERIRTAIAGSPNIRLIDATWDSARMRTLFASTDILLSLHRAEGFGIVPAEAMLRGISVIATGWSGSMQFMNEQSAALVPYRLVPVIEQRGDYAVPGARWAEPDHDAAVHWLRHLANDPAERAALAARGQAYASAALTLDPLANALQSCGIASLD
jgi:glycosyltransferase involved in cell wall biosynthesis